MNSNKVIGIKQSLNYSAIARRFKVTPTFVRYAIRGERTSKQALMIKDYILSMMKRAA